MNQLSANIGPRGKPELGLPVLIDRAARALANARTSAEILEARDGAAFAYGAAKASVRLAAAKGAHDHLIAAAHRARADALEIVAKAKRRLADEYDIAQKRDEVAKGRPKSIPNGNTFATLTDTDVSAGEGRQRSDQCRTSEAEHRLVRSTISRHALPRHFGAIHVGRTGRDVRNSPLEARW
jgi:hypothetical protein